MAGLVMDAVLMLLLVCAVGYGVRLEKKLTALRAGQMAFAGAVTELNAAAGRAEAALASLRASGQETDLLHDRIVKAREVKAQLEALIARGPGRAAPSAPEAAARAEEPVRIPAFAPQALSAAAAATPPAPIVAEAEDEAAARARRMAALAERIGGLTGAVGPASGAGTRPTPNGRADVAAIVQAMTANQDAQRRLKDARRSLDADLFAA